MTKLLVIAALITPMFAVARGVQPNDDWLTVQVCHITMQVPNNLKRNRREGIDSCIAEFENRDMLLSIDYGMYGGPEHKSDVTVDFTEQPFSIGGKTGTLATYLDTSLYARKHPERKYVAHLYVVVIPGSTDPPRQISLMMTVSARRAKELKIANRIFGSVRFD